MMENQGGSKKDEKKPIQVTDFDVSSPIDQKKATEILCGNSNMFYLMIAKFEDMTFMQMMQLIADAVDDAASTDPSDEKLYQEKMKKIMDPAHQLKSPAGYIGASHIHYACYFIQEGYLYEKYQQIYDYYPTLLEAGVHFRVASR